jgi:hypothetical protein
MDRVVNLDIDDIRDIVISVLEELKIISLNDIDKLSFQDESKRRYIKRRIQEIHYSDPPLSYQEVPQNPVG